MATADPNAPKQEVSKNIFVGILALKAIEHIAGKSGKDLKESDILAVAAKIGVDGPSAFEACNTADTARDEQFKKILFAAKP
jgi:hypothetical protein